VNLVHKSPWKQFIKFFSNKLEDCQVHVFL
jgi:hypothetical protein